MLRLVIMKHIISANDKKEDTFPITSDGNKISMLAFGGFVSCGEFLARTIAVNKFTVVSQNEFETRQFRF